jgi:hypothetical protein
MKKLYTFALLVLTYHTLWGSDFITQWTFSAGATQIRFSALTEGGAVNYTWTASPSGNSVQWQFYPSC